MATCAHCGKTVVFAGKHDGDYRFCDDLCHAYGPTLSVSHQIPLDVVSECIQEIHEGLCPNCKGNGPIDVHTSYAVESKIIYVSWDSSPEICCRSCGRRNQFEAIGFSLLFGWWSIFGLFITPVQVIRNIVGIMRGLIITKPSKQLEKSIRLSLAKHQIQNQ